LFPSWLLPSWLGVFGELMVGDHGVVVWLDVPGWMGPFTSRACSTAANPEAANIKLRTTAKPKLVIGFIVNLLLFK